MASVSKDRGGFRIRFYDGNGARKQIRVSGVTKGTAEKIARHVDVLNSARINNDAGAIDRQTALWLADIAQSLHDKLAAVGLVERRKLFTVREYVEKYIQSRTDLKERTRFLLRQSAGNLEERFGDHLIQSITEADALRSNSG